jgi:1-acyl-sn-glycerol-3-phosphate acyltransferase
MIRRTLGSAFLRAIGWQIRGTPPAPGHSGVLVAAPHTSNLDFPIMLATVWATGLRINYLAKKELFRPPLEPLLRRTGGIPTDRKNPGGLIDDLVGRASSGRSFLLVLAPEGTRKKAAGWKSGFYRIAREADIPVTPCAVDGATREVHFGPAVRLTGNVIADMDQMRAFYADKHGLRPELASPVRLSDDYRASGTQDTAGSRLQSS